MEAVLTLPTPQEIARLINRTVFRFGDERGLQDSLEKLFIDNEIPYAREVVMSPRNRIDFMSGSVGIEIKVDSPANAVQRQLWRYAESPLITSLILVTTRTKHKVIARELLGKEVVIVHLLASLF